MSSMSLHITVHYERWWQLCIISCTFAALAFFITRYDTFAVLDLYRCIAYVSLYVFSSVKCSRGNAGWLLMASSRRFQRLHSCTHKQTQMQFKNTHKCTDKIDNHRLPKWLSLYNRQLSSKLPSAWWFDYCHITHTHSHSKQPYLCLSVT